MSCFYCIFSTGLVIWVRIITHENKENLYSNWASLFYRCADFRLVKLVRLRFGFGVLKVQKSISLFLEFSLPGFYTDSFQEYLFAEFLAPLQLALQHAE